MVMVSNYCLWSLSYTPQEVKFQELSLHSSKGKENLILPIAMLYWSEWIIMIVIY